MARPGCRDKHKANVRNKKQLRRKWYPQVKVWIDMVVGALAMYNTRRRYLIKVPCFDSIQTSIMWMNEIMGSQSDVRCLNAFRMERHVLDGLCMDLIHYGLTPSRNMNILEKVGIFLYTIALGASNRVVCERFQRSGDTISRVIHEVLDTLVGRENGFNGLVRKLIQPRDRHFREVPMKIQCQERYDLFKDAIGCIDGTHIDACIPKAEQYPFFGRKKYCSFNVMEVCDFDMYFTFVHTGWEGSAHDARVFDHAVNTPGFNFPHPPPGNVFGIFSLEFGCYTFIVVDKLLKFSGKYYLLDKGYADKQGYMVPYSKVKYHKSQFQRAVPQNVEEGFNRIHSSLRTTIERCFGVLKQRWKILKSMPRFSISTQNDLILACFGIHNYILQHNWNDSFLEDNEVDEPVPIRREEGGTSDLLGGMYALRIKIAREIWASKSNIFDKFL